MLATCQGQLDPSSNASGSLVLYRASRGSDGALLEGRLVADGECIYIENQAGSRFLAAWPLPGTAWNPDPLVVSVSGVRLRPGSVAFFAGGEVPLKGSRIDWVQPPRAGCVTEKAWLVHTVYDSARST